MAIRHAAAAFLVLITLTACGPDAIPAKPNNLVGAPSASPSDSLSPTPAIETPAAVVPTTDVPVPVVTTQPAPVHTTAAAPKTTKPAAPKTTKAAPPAAVYYKNCDDVRAHGAAPLYRGQPGYRAGLDRDGDGVACEK